MDVDETLQIPLPIPVGTLVEYHGSVEYAHGEYVVVRHDEPFYASPREEYEDTVAYALALPDDTTEEVQYCNVRRKSLSVLQLPTRIDHGQVANPDRTKVE